MNIQSSQEGNDIENSSMQLIAEDVAHVDCGGMMDYSIFFTTDGKLYGMGYSKSGVLFSKSEDYYETPQLLTERVKYARCGYGDIVILKDDDSVWTWGTRYGRTDHRAVT